MDQKDSTLSPVSISDIKDQRSGLSSFVSRKAGKSHLVDEDFSAWKERRHFSDYEESLPKFHNESVKNIIDKLPAGARILDYGCGDAAIALQDIKSKYPYIICNGVTYPVDRDQLPRFTDIKVYREDGDTFLNKHKEQYDLIMAVQSIRYSPDYFATIKKAYRALKPGGILLIDMVQNASMPLVKNDGSLVNPKSLEFKLEAENYDVEIKNISDDRLADFLSYSFAIRKTEDKPTLKLPVKLVVIPEIKMPIEDRFDTKIPLLGIQMNKINYVYQLD
ncbi:hypothetical protein BH10PAT1_BH10PAT1_7270 [soil metagenome]